MIAFAPPRPRPLNRPAIALAADFAVFRAVVLRQLGAYVPKHIAAIVLDVGADDGPVCRRRVQRALRRLAADGVAMRGANGWTRTRSRAC